MTTPITQSELESYLWGAATLLRGYIDAGDYKQFIFPLMFFKRLCDVYDEERAVAIDEVGDDFPEYHRFLIPDDSHWNDVRAVASNVGIAIQNAMREIEKANPVLDGVFGDAPWTNKNRLSDATLTDLIEHFSTQTLSRERVNEDLLGQAYEYLIKKFADDSGHTAAEFYTNRTVVHLMTLLLEPEEGERIYDPTCGSGGMLLSAAAELKRRGKDTRTLKMYGQEINLMTSAIARMNLFLHGFEDFEIARGDTLANPHFRQGDKMQQFDVILANPPYSINAWNRTAWENDPRNIYGTPPQSRADYAFWQHILVSLNQQSGRCAILYPHGVLFRNEEKHMRIPLIKDDVIDAVIGLGPNLFYNSPMEACIVVCRMNKRKERQGNILFINAINEVTRERAFSYLKDDHIDKIVSAYQSYENTDGFAKIVPIQSVLDNEGNLNIPMYVRSRENGNDSEKSLDIVIAEWQQSSQRLRSSMDELLEPMDSAISPKPLPSRTTKFALSQMGHMAKQMNQMMRLYDKQALPLGQTLNQLDVEIPDLLFVKPPMQNFVKTLTGLLPLVDTTYSSINASALNQLMGSIPNVGAIVSSGIDNSLFSKFMMEQLGILTSSDSYINTISNMVLGNLDVMSSPSASMQHLFDAITNSSNLVSSELFGSIQMSLGATPGFESSIQNLLQSLTIDYGSELRSYLGDTTEVEVTVGILSGKLPFDELPDEFRSTFDEVRDWVYRNSISTTVIFLWVINMLWLIKDQGLESASAVSNLLLVFLILLRDKEL